MPTMQDSDQNTAAPDATGFDSLWLHPTSMNSERIRRKYGSYGIDVLRSDPAIRVANLHSLQGAQKICRTLAVAFYPREVDPLFAGEHRQILKGQSIGVVFQQHGWRVGKRHMYFGESGGFAACEPVATLMGGVPTNQLAIHAYVLVIEKCGRTFDYATIAEIHHPDYLRLVDLMELYPQASPQHVSLSPQVDRLLGVICDQIRALGGELDVAPGDSRLRGGLSR